MDNQLSSRIAHITNQLRPTTAFNGAFDPPRSLQERMAYFHTPGVSIAVIKDFKLEWAQGFGLRNVRTARIVTIKTLFQAASISKPIFALAVMRLVQDGQLNLDDDIQNTLSSWRIPANNGWQPKVTWRQILSHTAGLTGHGFPGYDPGEPLPSVPQILNGEAPANTSKVEVNMFPGTQFRYSGGGTTVAQQALMDLLNKPFPQIMNELVLVPLGLTNSTYEQPLPKAWHKKAATSHPWWGVPLKEKFRAHPEMAAAGLWTTPSDLAKLGLELLQVLHGKKAPTLLPAEVIESMLCPQLAHQKLGEGEFFGIGFICNGKDDGFYFGHGGWNEGFVSDMRFYKNTGNGAVVMINSNHGFPLLDEVMRAIGEAYEWPNALPPAKIPVSLANLPEYVGLYTTQTGMQFHVSVNDDGLLLQHGEQPPLPIFPSSELEFFTKALNAEFRFEKGESGIVALTVVQEGNQIKADRQSREH